MDSGIKRQLSTDDLDGFVTAPDAGAGKKRKRVFLKEGMAPRCCVVARIVLVLSLWVLLNFY